MQQKLLVMFIPTLCLIIDLINESSQNEKCYFINQKSNETWKLVWQDNFQSDDYFMDNWLIVENCDDVWENQKSCSIKENVKLQDGCLMMSAKEEKYDQWNYTGASLTTNRVFGYGRFEARAALSVDRDVWSFFYTKTYDWAKNGYLRMLEFEKISKSYQTAVFSEEDKVFKKRNLDNDYSLFHLYGMEWSEKEIKFFIDDHYTEPILLSATRKIKPEQPIQLWLGVNDFYGSLPEKHNWKCPLFIVDYVRVYEKVSNPNVGLKLELCKKQNDVDQSIQKQREIVNSLCGIKMIATTPPTTNVHQPSSNFNSTSINSSLFWSNINSFVYGSFGSATILFIAFIVHQRYRINKLKQPKVDSPHLDEIELENRHQYETISYDDVRETTF